MAQRPKVDKLPAEIRDAAYALLRAGRTVDDITEHLQSLGADVSRSGVGRWKKGAEKSMQALKRAQALGEGWAKSLSEDPEGKVGRLLIELGKTAVLDNMLAKSDSEDDDGETKPLDTKDLFFLSSAVKNFESAGNMNIARELRIRKEAVAKAADAVAEVAKAAGMTKDGVAALRKAAMSTTV